MDTIIYLLKGAFKILLLMIGAAMLFGGGICVVADAFFIFSSQAGSVAIWLGASALVALIGWGSSHWLNRYDRLRLTNQITQRK